MWHRCFEDGAKSPAVELGVVVSTLELVVAVEAPDVPTALEIEVVPALRARVSAFKPAVSAPVAPLFWEWVLHFASSGLRVGATGALIENLLAFMLLPNVICLASEMCQFEGATGSTSCDL